jgi:hypothetical protein
MFIYLPMSEDLKPVRVTQMMSHAEVKAIDDWSFANRIRSRGEAIRRLIELGLEAAKAKPPRAKGKRDAT